MQDEITGMSVVLLVKPDGLDSLFRVSTFEEEETPFEVWKNRNGVNLLWKGRRVEKVYSMTGSGERWWSVPVPDAVKSLLKRGKAKRIKPTPTPKGELPR